MSKNSHSALLRALKHNIKQDIYQKNWSATQQGLAELKQLEPLALETRGLELDYLVAAKQVAEANMLAKQLLQLFPASSRIHYLSGLLAYRDKKYSTALLAFEQSHRIYPHWRTARYIGKTCTQSGDFDAAEAQLLQLSPKYPVCLLDLVWLYERKQQYSRAREYLEQYLHHRPDDEFAQQQRLRLQAQVLTVEQIQQEVVSLTDFDESIPIGLLGEYVRSQLETANGIELRQWLEPQIAKLNPKDCVRLAWICYRLNAYDLSYRLFLVDFNQQYNNAKYRSAIERSAHRAGQTENLIATYEQYCDMDKRFYGRLINLRKRLD